MPNSAAKALATRTADSYSAPRYRSWVAVCGALLQMEFSFADAEIILRSKLTRWAADHHPTYPASAKALVDFLRANPEAVKRTFADEARPALVPFNVGDRVKVTQSTRHPRGTVARIVGISPALAMAAIRIKGVDYWYDEGCLTLIQKGK